METSISTVTAKDLEIHANQFDSTQAAKIYNDHGALVIRGMSADHVSPVLHDMNETLERARAMLPYAKKSPTHANAWVTPDGSLFNEDPAQPGEKLINTLKFNSLVSAAFLNSLLNPDLLDLLEIVLGPDIELWKWGQCVYRQPDSGLPKSLHQDEYYFEHQYHSSTALLSYATDVDMENSPLYVVPGSHKLGIIEHVDDQWAGFALPDQHWWDKAVPVTGKAGDGILFHGLTIHGSPANRSSRARPVFIQRYRRADDFCVINVGNSADRRDAETHRLTEKAMDDWGLMVRGLRRFQMPQSCVKSSTTK